MTIIPQTPPDVNPATSNAPAAVDLTRLSPAALQHRRGKAHTKRSGQRSTDCGPSRGDAMLRLDAADAEQGRRVALEGGAK
jgi:hypothetical protein